MELATALIWTLRIVLPIVLFCFYFKLQSPKDEASSVESKYHISRSKILARRQASLEGCVVPEALHTLALKDQTQAPALFTPSGRQMRGGGRREDRAPRERREKREPRAKTAERPREEHVEEPPAAESPAAAAAAVVDSPGPNEEKVHLESLLNYVAFNRKEQQRTFLLDEEDAPPPPPPKPRKPSVAAGDAASPVSGAGGAEKATEEAARKANADAQLVLRGAINYKRADVAKDIYGKLSETNVEISERTFALMIEASVLARDLKSASDFLMKMETSGFCPDSEILDKVMDLYSQQKQRKEQERSLKTVGTNLLAETVSAGNEFSPEAGPRAKLSSDARIFVPSFGAPPPPSPPPPPTAPPPSAVAAPAGAVDMMLSESLRTKLTAAAKPFEPQFNYKFDSFSYAWSPGADWAEDAPMEGKGKGGGGKKQGKGAMRGEGGEYKASAKARSKKEKAKEGPQDEPSDNVDTEPEASKSNKENREAKKVAKTWRPKRAGEEEEEAEA